MKKLFLTLLIVHCSLIIASAQWVFQQSGVKTPLYDIKFINSVTGWTCGDNGIILKTTNAGLNWVIQPTEAIGKYLFSIHPVNDSVVYCAGWFETILKTTNGGNNWITIQNGPVGQGHSYLSVFFLNENTGLISSTYSPQSKIMKTTDGGLSWKDYFTLLRYHDMFFKDSTNGIGTSGASYYGTTSNGGLNWFPYSVGEGDYDDISTMPYNKNIGFIVSSIGYSVRKTTNFGMTFDSVGNIPNVPHELYCSKFINENIGWAGGSYGQLYKTENGGKIWRTQNSLSEAFIGKFSALNDSVVWACGGGGKIIHTTNGGDTITSIQQISTNIPDKFELYQNYPNPFNPMTNVKWQMLNSGNAKIVVFDILGKEIATLVNEKLKPGIYEVTFDGSNLSSGIYFYRLESENNFIVKRMILIK